MVSATSLNNLIPMPSKWGVATKAIRVPIELAEEFLEMANNWAQKFREELAAKAPNIQLGQIVEVPADLTDEEWEQGLYEMEKPGSTTAGLWVRLDLNLFKA